jgi:hypothetical protein
LQSRREHGPASVTAADLAVRAKSSQIGIVTVVVVSQVAAMGLWITNSRNPAFKREKNRQKAKRPKPPFECCFDLP